MAALCKSGVALMTMTSAVRERDMKAITKILSQIQKTATKLVELQEMAAIESQRRWGE